MVSRQDELDLWCLILVGKIHAEQELGLDETQWRLQDFVFGGSVVVKLGICHGAIKK